jgi:hypothetical protein
VEKIAKKELHNFLVFAMYCLDNKIMEDEIVGACSMHLEIRNASKF